MPCKGVNAIALVAGHLASVTSTQACTLKHPNGRPIIQSTEYSIAINFRRVDDTGFHKRIFAQDRETLH